MDIDTVFNIVVIIFTVANLMAGGLACDLKEAMQSANAMAARNVDHRGAEGLRFHLRGQVHRGEELFR